MAGKPGTCGFCGTGDGWLGEQGDESTQYLHSAVRTGEAGDWKYERHPNAVGDGQMIIWCGHCLPGLTHKFQRYDDHNLSAEILALKFWLELDGPRWGAWDAVSDEDRATAMKHRDDTAIHMDKLARQSRLRDLQNEQFRRAGAPMNGWRTGE